MWQLQGIVYFHQPSSFFQGQSNITGQYKVALRVWISTITSRIACAIVLHVHVPVFPLGGGKHKRTIMPGLDTPVALFTGISLLPSNIASTIIFHVEVPSGPALWWNEVQVVFTKWCEDELSLIARQTSRSPAPNIPALFVWLIPCTCMKGREYFLVWSSASNMFMCKFVAILALLLVNILSNYPAAMHMRKG